jgi:hypothetical protein
MLRPGPAKVTNADNQLHRPDWRVGARACARAPVQQRREVRYREQVAPRAETADVANRLKVEWLVLLPEQSEELEVHTNAHDRPLR